VNDFLTQLLRAQTYRFVGRCGATPEVKYFQSGAAVANVNIAINQPDAKKDDGKPADWIRLEVWGADQAQAFADACQKGTLVDVSGRVRSNTYTDRNNETKHQWVMKVEQWAPAGGQQTPATAATARPAAAAAAPAQPTAWATSNDDDSIPF
jgi:single-strand DNA-binding protein